MNQWIKNEGGNCPVEIGAKIIVKHRSGFEYPCKAGDTWSRDWKFGDVDRDGDIVCYRLVEDKQPAPLTRDQALAWLVENVNEWPLVANPPFSLHGWEWSYGKGVGFYRNNIGTLQNPQEPISKQDWQSSQPAPPSNKPSWDDAPEAAKWLCQDADGMWAFSSGDHSPVNYTTYWRNKDAGFWFKNRRKDKPNPNWRDTLERRPGAAEKTCDADFGDAMGLDGLIPRGRKIIDGNLVDLRCDKELDPSGLSSSEPGAKLDAGQIRPDLILSGMPRALLAVSEVATFGIGKYSENGWLSVPDGIKRYTAAMDRHRLKEGIEPLDGDSELRHAAHLAWNALARLELMLINE